MPKTLTSKQLGNKAEEIAIRYLSKKGFLIKSRNYRLKRAEIDIIAQQEKLLVFIDDFKLC